jgi:hypothetical protein
MIWKHKALQVHPMRLFMYISIFDAALFSNYWFSSVICPWKLYYIPAATIRFDNDENTRVTALYYMVVLKKAIDNALWVASAVLNTFVCLDLVLVVWYPLNPKEKRINWYMLVTSIMSIMVFGVSLHPGSDIQMVFNISNWFIFVCYSCFFLTAVSSAVIACISLNKPGVSREMR